jgi:hypothetical protein
MAPGLKPPKSDQYSICDHYIENIYPLLIGSGHGLADEHKEVIKQKEEKEREETALSWLQSIYRADSPQYAKALADEVNAEKILSGNALNWFNYTYYSLNGEYGKAKAELAAIHPLNQDEKERLQLENLMTDKFIMQSDMYKLSAGEQSMLRDIDDRRGTYASVARDLLHLAVHAHDYIFTQPAVPVANPKAEYKGMYDLSEEYINVFPNPASSTITVKYNVNQSDGKYLHIVDVTGREVSRVPLHYTSTSLPLDISTLGDGMYFIFISHGDNKGVLQARFVKH